MITNEDKDYIDTCEYVRIQFFAMKLDVYFVFEMFPFSRAVKIYKCAREIYYGDRNASSIISKMIC